VAQIWKGRGAQEEGRGKERREARAWQGTTDEKVDDDDDDMAAVVMVRIRMNEYTQE
jgi:hypothetical protein